MRVALVNPPSPFLIDDKVFPPLGILYVEAVLESSGHDVEMVDLSGLPRGKWSRKLEKARQAELWGITFTTPQFPYAVSIRDIIKEIDKDAKIVAGGAHPTADPASCIPFFDSVVVGEGERAVPRLIQNIENMPKLVQTPPIENLDEVPFPARHLIDIDSYHYSIDGKKTTNIITSRGCPYNCAFCCKIWGRGYELGAQITCLPG